jgi:hypothetical protein
MLAACFSASVTSFARSNQPITLAEVRAQLVQLEKAGYKPGPMRQTIRWTSRPPKHVSLPKMVRLAVSAAWLEMHRNLGFTNANQ